MSSSHTIGNARPDTPAASAQHDEIVVHSVPGSPFGRAVLIALEEKHAHYRFAPVAPQTMRTAQHLARHPFGRIPVIEHGEFRLYETQAILRYIDRVLPGPSLTPPDVRSAARMDQLMNVNDWYLFQGVGNVIAFQRIVGPKLLGITPDEAVIAAAMPKAEQVFKELERQLAGREFFVADSLTLADVLLVPQLDFLSLTPEWSHLTADKPRVCRWLHQMNARASLIATTWERVADLARNA